MSKSSNAIISIGATSSRELAAWFLILRTTTLSLLEWCVFMLVLLLNMSHRHSCWQWHKHNAAATKHIRSLPSLFDILSASSAGEWPLVLRAIRSAPCWSSSCVHRGWLPEIANSRAVLPFCNTVQAQAGQNCSISRSHLCVPKCTVFIYSSRYLLFYMDMLTVHVNCD